MMMKKLMKRALLLLIAAVMLFQMIPVAIAGEPLGDREDEEEKGQGSVHDIPPDMKQSWNELYTSTPQKAIRKTRREEVT